MTLTTLSESRHLVTATATVTPLPTYSARLVETKSKESRRTVSLPTVVVRALKSQKVKQAEARIAAGKEWHASDFVFTTRIGRH
jgi:hypothetical protein